MIDGLEPYPKMKDSGIDWLADVPAHWEVRRLRNVARILFSNVDKHTRDDEYPVRLCNYLDVYHNDRIRADMDFMKATATPEELERFRLMAGDVIITKDSESWSDIGVPAFVENTYHDVICGYHLALLRPIRDEIGGEYLYRALVCQSIADQLYICANGVTRFGLSQTAIKSVLLPIPSFPEQTAIARFLDHINSRIDRYIRAKEKLITLLEEQKQAIIHQAVTGRIDVRTGCPYPAYKPSGVEWLGEVPAHWQGLALKRWVCRRITDGPHETPIFQSTGVPFMSAESMVEGKLDFNRARGFISYDQHKVYCKKCRPQRNDIFMCKSGATTGKLAYVETDDEFSVWSPLALIRVDPQRVIPRLLFLVLLSPYVQRQVKDTWSYGTQPNLSMAAMERLFVVLPPIDEQRQIFAYLSENSNEKARIDTIRRQINFLKEYHARLIADVVTGKLDVRNAVAELPESMPDMDEDRVGAVQADASLRMAEELIAQEEESR